MQRFIGIIAGIICIGLGVFMYFRHENLVKNCTQEAVATVEDMDQELSTDDNGTSYIYHPIIEYTANGNTIRAKMDSGSSMPAYNIGDKINIMYNPNNVKEFIVKGENTSNIFSIIFVAVGVLVTGAGIKMAIKKD